METLLQVVKGILLNPIQVVNGLCLWHITQTYLGKCAKLSGASMLPTLNGEVILTESITAQLGKLGPGDVVVFRSPIEARKMVVKRIVGVEGDEVSYLVDPLRSDEQKTVVVPKGHVWVQGDNIYNSRDSRMFGPVPYALLQARIFLVVWPPDNFGFVNHKVR